jgi:uroporphyrinogen-III synthase
MPFMMDGLRGMRVVSFESRRSEDMANLIRRHGGEPLQAPSMQEIPLSEQTQAMTFGETLLGGGCDVLILLTGVGTRVLVDALQTRWPAADIVDAIARTATVCRGPKPVAALKELGLKPTLIVPEPNTWRDLVVALDTELPVPGKRVAIQEYGARNLELLRALEARAATVTSVPVYAWALPDDVAPLRHAIGRAIAGELDAALFTSATQADHLFQVAAAAGQADDLSRAFRERMVVASVGPVTSEALERLGIPAEVTPAHPKMGHLVAALAEQAATLLERKRGDRS